MEHKITGCVGCPMFNMDSEYGDRCNHPDFLELLKGHSPEVYIGKDIPAGCVVDINKGTDKGSVWVQLTPDWCPLKKESITITY